jgi:hypothetical protein
MSEVGGLKRKKQSKILFAHLSHPQYAVDDGNPFMNCREGPSPT